MFIDKDVFSVSHRSYSLHAIIKIMFYRCNRNLYQSYMQNCKPRLVNRNNYEAFDWSIRLREERISHRSCIRCPWILSNLIDCRTGWWSHSCKRICCIWHSCCKYIHVQLLMYNNLWYLLWKFISNI